MKKTSHIARSAIQSLVFASTALFLASAAHADMHAAKGNKDTYNQAKADAKAKYDADKEKCKQLSGNAADVCKAEAKLQEVTSVSTAEAHYKNTPKAAHEARKDIAEAQYDLAKEKCDDKTGNDKDVCKKEAEAAYTAAKADADVKLKTRKAINDASEEKTDAKYAAAKEKCDALAGDAKDACQAKAKADFAK